MTKEQVLDNFWNGFDIPAFDENSVPDEIWDETNQQSVKLEPPYITYEVGVDDFDHPVALTASLWYRSSSWLEITEKEQEISDFITRGGRMIKYDRGAMWLQKANPWAQRLEEASDDMIRRIVLNIYIEFLD